MIYDLPMCVKITIILVSWIISQALIYMLLFFMVQIEQNSIWTWCFKRYKYICYIGGVVIPFALFSGDQSFLKKLLDTFRAINIRDTIEIHKTAISILIGFAIFLINCGIQLMLKKLWRKKQRVSAEDSSKANWYSVLLVPFLEELLFRGIYYDSFLEIFSIPTSMLFVALFFGVMHLIPKNMPGAFLCSILLSLLYIYTGALVFPMIAHSIYNISVSIYQRYYKQRDRTEVSKATSLKEEPM
jgi:membrane protease YdiL (CAAX protease family)